MKGKKKKKTLLLRLCALGTNADICTKPINVHLKAQLADG
jgi:hypothetical protein